MDVPNFSPELRSEVTGALVAYADSAGADADARLKAVMDRVCRESHALEMKPEAMIIALRQFYNSLPFGDIAAQERLRGAYDRLLTGCIEAYFATKS